jgi:hypothetical protein
MLCYMYSSYTTDRLGDRLYLTHYPTHLVSKYGYRVWLLSKVRGYKPAPSGGITDFTIDQESVKIQV